MHKTSVRFKKHIFLEVRISMERVCALPNSLESRRKELSRIDNSAK